jgi:hypothetical protein
MKSDVPDPRNPAKWLAADLRPTDHHAEIRLYRPDCVQCCRRIDVRYVEYGAPGGTGGGAEIGKIGVTMGDIIGKGHNQRGGTTRLDQCLERNSRTLYGADENRWHC